MLHHGKVAVVEEPQDVYLPLWRELFTAWECVSLKASPVFYGFGVPRGDGSPVVVVPGFLGSDLYLLDLYFWLRRIGYRSYMSRIGHNAECLDLLTRRLLRTVNRVHARTGRRVHLIGHSLGGVYARAVASLVPHQVASVITLGTPFHGIRVNPHILTAISFVRSRVQRNVYRHRECNTAACPCGFTALVGGDFPVHIPQTAVFTRSDGVVHWEACVNNNPRTDVEVSGTHIGMVWNTEVYRVIAERLERARQHLEAQDTRPADSRSGARPRAAARKAGTAGKPGRVRTGGAPRGSMRSSRVLNAPPTV